MLPRFVYLNILFKSIDVTQTMSFVQLHDSELLSELICKIKQLLCYIQEL